MHFHRFFLSSNYFIFHVCMCVCICVCVYVCGVSVRGQLGVIIFLIPPYESCGIKFRLSGMAGSVLPAEPFVPQTHPHLLPALAFTASASVSSFPCPLLFPLWLLMLYPSSTFFLFLFLLPGPLFFAPPSSCSSVIGRQTFKAVAERMLYVCEELLEELPVPWRSRESAVLCRNTQTLLAQALHGLKTVLLLWSCVL